jgi:hypothetical protein
LRLRRLRLWRWLRLWIRRRLLRPIRLRLRRLWLLWLLLLRRRLFLRRLGETGDRQSKEAGRCQRHCPSVD